MSTIDPKPSEVTVVDFNMSFGRMVVFMVKFAVAAIPAALILACIGFALAGVLAGLFSHIRV